MKKKFGLIIPVYGQFEYVAKCLDTMVRYCSDYYCILIDDGSPDWDDKWEAAFRRMVPPDCLYFERFAQNQGVTATWNYGLELARKFETEIAVIVNSDTLFSPGCLVRTAISLEKVDLMGPMSNAAGNLPDQQIENMIRSYKVSDDLDDLAELSARLREQYRGQIKECRVNGFWMAARTEIWWKNAFDAKHVFDPKNRITGNESEYQKRFKGKIGAVRDVFIFHYRSVSRGLENVNPEYCKGAYRLAETTGDGLPASLVEVISPKSGKCLRVINESAEEVAGEGLVLKVGITTPVSEVRAQFAQAYSGAEKFDSIYLGDALGWYHEPASMLEVAAEYLRKGGRVTMMFENDRHRKSICSLWFKRQNSFSVGMGRDASVLRRFGTRNMIDMAEFSNLRIKAWYYAVADEDVSRHEEPAGFWNDLAVKKYWVEAEKL